MDFYEVVKKRRSVRKFTSEVIPEDVMNRILDAGLLAPNSSNLQPWEFYWVKNQQKKEELKLACFSQKAATTASELIVAVSRIDTWKRNRDLLMEALSHQGKIPSAVKMYYQKAIPIAYFQDPFGIASIIKKIAFTLIGFFRPTPRKTSRADLFETVSKTTALACENIMLAIVNEGYDCCPMEGFDEVRVKKILGLNSKTHIVMIIGMGKGDPTGIFGKQVRLDRSLFIHKVTD